MRETRYTKFTDATVKGLEREDGQDQSFFWDDPAQGGVQRLGLIVGATKRTFIVNHAKIGRRKIGVFPVMNVATARQTAKEWLLEMDRGNDPTAKPEAPERDWKTYTVKQACVEYVAYAKSNGRSDTTIEQIEDEIVGRRLKPWIDEERALLSIKRAECEALLNTIRDTIRKSKGKAGHKVDDYTGNAAANRALKFFKAIHNYVAAKFADQSFPQNANPVGRKFPFMPERDRKSKLAWDSLETWWTATQELCEGSREYAKGALRDTYRFTLLTGLRNADCCSIRWEHLDRKAGTLHRPKPKGGHKAAFTIPLSKAALAIIARRERENPDDDGGYVFPIKRDDGTVSCRPKLHVPKGNAGVGRLHDLRRTFKNAARVCGVDEYNQNLLMNHEAPTKSRKMGDVYSDTELDDLRNDTQRISDFLLGKAGLAVIGGEIVAATADTKADEQALQKQIADLQAKLAGIKQQQRGAA
jgi:integrase